MLSVGKAAAEIIQEVRHQFLTHTNEAGFTLGECIRKYKAKCAPPGSNPPPTHTPRSDPPSTPRPHAHRSRRPPPCKAALSL